MTASMRTSLTWSDLQLFLNFIFMLGTQVWQKILDEHREGEFEESPESIEGENPLNAIDWLVEHFLVPLE